MEKVMTIGGFALVFVGSCLISADYVVAGGLTLTVGANMTGWIAGVKQTANNMDREGYLKEEWYKKYSKK